MTDQMVKNLDVAHLADMLTRDMREVSRCQSASANVFIPADRNRLKAYLEQYQGYIDWAVAKSRDDGGAFNTMDMPRTHPTNYDLQPELPDVEGGVENELVRTILRHFSAMRYEIIHSQSANLASGLLPADKQRMESFVDRLMKLIEEYIDKIIPVDQPETSQQPNKQSSADGQPENQ